MLLPAAIAIATVPVVQPRPPGEVFATAPVLDAADAVQGAKGPAAGVSPQEAGSQAGPLPVPPAAPQPATPAPANAPNPPASGNEIIVTAEGPPPPGDPLEHLNETSFHAVEAVDKAFVGPLAKGYAHDVPGPVRHGLHNFISNLHEPVVFVSFLLEGKPGKAIETLGRFAINSTIGIAGLVDVARRKPFHLRHYRNGFADVMGYYGIGPGPFLMLPLLGPTTARDLVGTVLDLAALPTPPVAAFKTPAYKAGLFTVRSLDQRVRHNQRLKEIRASVDPYATLRETYLCQRSREIAGLHNRQPPACLPMALSNLTPSPASAATVAAPAGQAHQAPTASSPAPVPTPSVKGGS